MLHRTPQVPPTLPRPARLVILISTITPFTNAIVQQDRKGKGKAVTAEQYIPDPDYIPDS